MYIDTLSYSNESYWRKESQLQNITVDSSYSGNFSTNNVNAAISFLKSLDKKTVESGLLPPGLRLILPGCIIFERPPSMQLVQYIDSSVESIIELEENEDYDALEPHVFQIPIPWQLYIATYSTHPGSMYRVTDVRMYFMNTPLTHPDVNLYAPYIPNFFTDAHLCSPMFDDHYEINRYSQDLAGVMSSAYDWVWNTGFNADLRECIDQTINQLRNINPIVKDFYNDYRNSDKYYNSSMYTAFYKFLSNYSIEDVVNLTWANISYTTYFDRDYDFIYNSDSPLVEKFRDSEDYDENNDDVRYFKNWLDSVVSIHNLQKTYNDIINALFYPNENNYISKHYKELLDPSNIALKNLSYFHQSMLNSVLANPSI